MTVTPEQQTAFASRIPEFDHASGSASAWPTEVEVAGSDLVPLRLHLKRLEDVLAEALSIQHGVPKDAKPDVPDWGNVAVLLKLARRVEGVSVDGSEFENGPHMCSPLNTAEDRGVMMSSIFAGCTLVFQQVFFALEATVRRCDFESGASGRDDLSKRLDAHIKRCAHLLPDLKGLKETGAALKEAIGRIGLKPVDDKAGDDETGMLRNSVVRLRRLRNIFLHGMIEPPTSFGIDSKEDDFDDALWQARSFHLATRLSLLVMQLIIHRCIDGKGFTTSSELGREYLWDDDDYPMDNRLLDLHLGASADF